MDRLDQEMPDLREEGVETAVMQAIINIEEEMTKILARATYAERSRRRLNAFRAQAQ
jgi:hypothetical protein